MKLAVSAEAEIASFFQVALGTRKRLRVEMERLIGDMLKPNAVQARGSAGKAPSYHLCTDTDCLENLGTAIT